MDLEKHARPAHTHWHISRSTGFLGRPHLGILGLVCSHQVLLGVYVVTFLLDEVKSVSYPLFSRAVLAGVLPTRGLCDEAIEIRLGHQAS